MNDLITNSVLSHGISLPQIQMVLWYPVDYLGERIQDVQGEAETRPEADATRV